MGSYNNNYIVFFINYICLFSRGFCVEDRGVVMWHLLIALFYTIYKVYALVDCLKSCFSLCFDSVKDMTLFEEKKEMNRYFECYFAEK